LARRLLALLVIACACGAAAISVSNGRAAKESVPATHIPAIPAAAPVGDRCPIPRRFRPAFEYAADDTRLPLALLTAVARVESEVSSHPQVIPTTADVLAGARYLKTLFERFPSGDLALAAYNAGPNAVARAAAPTEETLTYVADVTSIWRALAGCR
jgi:soluble lytic murein transglycosylase-like protein